MSRRERGVTAEGVNKQGVINREGAPIRHPITIWTFLCLVWSEWSSRVTGSLSAILVLLGLGISIASASGVSIPAAPIVQIATWALAAICGGQAGYDVWAKERAARNEAEAKQAELAARLTPNMQIYIDGSGIRERPTESASGK
jgi:hypothetical protein